MAIEAAALAAPQTETTETAVYEALYAALSASARGRAFLAEHARRSRQADTEILLTAVARLEERMAAQAEALAEAQRQAARAEPAVESAGAPEATAHVDALAAIDEAPAIEAAPVVEAAFEAAAVAEAALEPAQVAVIDVMPPAIDTIPDDVIAVGPGPAGQEPVAGLSAEADATEPRLPLPEVPAEVAAIMARQVTVESLVAQLAEMPEYDPTPVATETLLPVVEPTPPAEHLRYEPAASTPLPSPFEDMPQTPAAERSVPPVTAAALSNDFEFDVVDIAAPGAAVVESIAEPVVERAAEPVTTETVAIAPAFPDILLPEPVDPRGATASHSEADETVRLEAVPPIDEPAQRELLRTVMAMSEEERIALFT